MVQFNLLPDVKLEYIKAERTKRMVMGVSFIAGAAALVVFVLLLLTVDGVQKTHIRDLNKDISSKSSELKSTPSLDKILTVQSQLGALTALHDAKPVDSRLFTYLSQIVPSEVTISDLKLDHTANTLQLTGKAPTLDIVNIFTDTLKFTKYVSSADPSASTKAFSDVVLTSFGRDKDSASYTINATIDPLIFSNANQIQLIVPSQVTTRSEVERPKNLFEKATTTAGGQ